MVFFKIVASCLALQLYCYKIQSLSLSLFFFFLSFCLFKAAPVAYGGSWAGV